MLEEWNIYVFLAKNGKKKENMLKGVLKIFWKCVELSVLHYFVQSQGSWIAMYSHHSTKKKKQGNLLFSLCIWFHFKRKLIRKMYNNLFLYFGCFSMQMNLKFVYLRNVHVLIFWMFFTWKFIFTLKFIVQLTFK